MKYLDYQEKAINELLMNSIKVISNSLLGSSILFESPTGSGKTYMISEYVNRLATQYKSDLSFIWVAPRSLHVQSCQKLKNIYNNSNLLNPIYFSEIQGNVLENNDILFMNWESINKQDNLIYRENENEFYLNKVISNTKDNGNKIILIIDESHYSMVTRNSHKLIKEINPYLTIGISATPKSINEDHKVLVSREDVINEEMIKKGVIINESFQNEIIEEKSNKQIDFKTDAIESTNEFVIKTALNKHSDLKKLYSQKGSIINPLMLIQLPDSKNNTKSDVQKEVIDYLSDQDITIENGKLAIWLDKQKENLSHIEDLDNNVDVLIFKQAIALGWDCPRACVLVTLRDWKNYIFSTQTLGRIMRMPEYKHYANDLLNYAYVYTNGDSLQIDPDLANGLAFINTAYIKDSINKNDWSDVKLQSYHLRRQRERTRLNPYFINIFLDTFKEGNFNGAIDFDDDQFEINLISDEKVDIISQDTQINSSVSREIVSKELQIEFDQFLANSMEPLYPEERSVKRISSSIYKLFYEEFNFNFSENLNFFREGSGYSNEDRIKRIVMSDSNKGLFEHLIKQSIVNYIIDSTSKSRVFDEFVFEFQRFVNYSSFYEAHEYSLSLMTPFYMQSNASFVEKDFVTFLEKYPDKISYFYKNGDSGMQHFAVKRSDDSGAFYVDWIIKYKDGSIGLYDTKAGWTAQTAKTRAEGLYKYIYEENKQGAKLKGGIVMPWWHEPRWLIHDSENYEEFEDHPTLTELKNKSWKAFIL